MGSLTLHICSKQRKIHTVCLFFRAALGNRPPHWPQGVRCQEAARQLQCTSGIQ